MYTVADFQKLAVLLIGTAAYFKPLTLTCRGENIICITFNNDITVNNSKLLKGEIVIYNSSHFKTLQNFTKKQMKYC